MSQKSTVLRRHIKRAFEILTHQGPKALINKVKLRLSDRKTLPPAPAAEETLAFAAIDREPLPETLSLAVHLHLYYDDLAEEFAIALQNIPLPFDLFVSVKKDLPDDRIQALRALFEDRLSLSSEERGRESAAAGGVLPAGRLIIRRAENRGRDMAPMFVLFGRELSAYSFVLHLHSKKSLYTGTEQEDWRQYSVRTLIGSPEAAARLLKIAAHHPETGLIYPKRFSGMPPEAYGWLSNEKKGRDFLESLGIPFRTGVFLYPAGSFFLVRSDSIRPIWKRHLALSDFDEEAGQTDGTLAHVLERAIGPVAEAGGYVSAIIDPDDRSVHLGRDRDTFAPVFRRDFSYLKTECMSYDLVSFDVFDTLLTRKYAAPSDLFTKIPAAAGLSVPAPEDFRRLRLQAENEAVLKKGAATCLDDIYDVLAEEEHFSTEERKALQEAELALEEDALLPRRDMTALFKALSKAGKNIILVSDMYLPRSFYEKVLEKHGLTGAKRLYLSCEEGLRKEDSSLWEKVFSDFPGKTLCHIGDNRQSDWQVLSDRKEKAIWIMNPRDEGAIAGLSLLQGPAAEAAPPLVRGLFQNGGLFNSPFALSPDGQPRFSDPYAFGYTAFGPLFYEFMSWLHENTERTACLAFLAREGYWFEKLYTAVAGPRAKDHLYLLTSRRAASVAAIRSEEDIYGILRRAYDGSLRNLLSARLGAGEELTGRLPDRQIHIAPEESGEADDYEKTCSAIAPLLPALLQNAAEERKAYLSYLDRALPEEKRKRCVLVDVGYAGTIQYYLSRLLGTPLSAAYLAVFTPHPGLQALSCPVFAMYEKGRDAFADVIEKTQLFLEAVLSAPYGQLLHFDGSGQPVYREEDGPSAGIRSLQEGILSYCRDRALAEALTKRAPAAAGRTVPPAASKEDAAGNSPELPAFTGSLQETDKASRSFMEETYRELLLGHDYLTKDIAALFSVEDRYSQDTCLHLNPETHRWEI